MNTCGSHEKEKKINQKRPIDKFSLFRPHILLLMLSNPKRQVG